MVSESCRGGREHEDGITSLPIHCHLARFSVFDKKIKIKKRWLSKMEHGNIKKSKTYIRVNMTKAWRLADLKCISPE